MGYFFEKKVIKIINAFQKLLKECNCKPHKTWVDKCREFYNRSMTPWLGKRT